MKMKLNIICNKITEVVVSLFEPDDKLMKGYCEHPSKVIEITSLREHRINTDGEIKQMIQEIPRNKSNALQLEILTQMMGSESINKPMSSVEIAKITGSSDSAIRKAKQRAERKMQEGIEETQSNPTFVFLKEELGLFENDYQGDDVWLN
jgi:hypothetical protein